MKIVHHFAGMELDESDVLRRIMSGKKHDGDTFDRLRHKFFAGARVQGHGEEVAKEVWRQVESFSGYSFCKAHSASFAVESFQSLYLKAYYPLEFIVGVINNFGGFYKTEFYIHEARMDGAIIEPPCVNNSLYLTTLKIKTLYVGFIHVKGINQQLIQDMLIERSRAGAFRDLTDFCARVEVDGSQLDLLIRCGGFQFTGRTKAELFWEKNTVFNPKQNQVKEPELFEVAGPRQYFHLDLSPNHRPGHPLSARQLDQAFDELELLGFPLCSPFLLVKGSDVPVRRPEEELPKSLVEVMLDGSVVGADSDTGASVTSDLRSSPSAQKPPFGFGTNSVNSWGNRSIPNRLWQSKENSHLSLKAYFVCDKLVPTIKGDRMSFGCWIDENGQYFDTVHFPDSLRAFPFQGAGVYELHGLVSWDFGFPGLEVFRMLRLAYLGDGRFG